MAKIETNELDVKLIAVESYGKCRSLNSFVETMLLKSGTPELFCCLSQAFPERLNQSAPSNNRQLAENVINF